MRIRCVAVFTAQSVQAGVFADVRRRRIEEQTILHNDFRDFRELSSEDLRHRIASYRAETEAYRENAQQVAVQAQAVGLPAGSGAQIRQALAADMSLWRYLMPVSDRDWNAMTRQWIVPVANLTDRQWAQQRAAWFVARDAWLNKRVSDAQLVRN